MSFWTTVQGYMFLDLGPGPKFGKHASDENWNMLLRFSDTMDLINMFLINPRELSAASIKSKFALTIEWYNLDTQEEDYEYFVVPEEDSKALQCPTGSEGPIDYFINPIFKVSRNGFFIGFEGRLRDKNNGEFVVNWWNTLKKYLPIVSGFIRVNSEITKFNEIYEQEP